jgi:hypothetical protein
VATGDGGREAYTPIAWGAGLSHERSDIAGAESFYSLEGNMCGTVYARCCRPAGVEGHITCKRIASEAGRSRVWPSASRERTMESKCLSAFRGAIVHPVTFPRGPPSSQACQRPSVGADLGWNRLLSGKYGLRSCSMTRAIRTQRTGGHEVLVKTLGSTVLLA